MTTEQRADIVLRLSKTTDSGMKYTYLFDAKYRINDKPINGMDVPPEDAINQMHRYLDAIYYTEDGKDCDIMKIKSRRRNPVLADIFSRLKYMERRGSGFKKICNEYAHQVNYREDIKPKFYSDNSDFVLTLFNLNYGINAESNEYIQDAILPQTAPNCPKLPQTAPNLNHNLNSFLKVIKNFPGGTIRLLAQEASIGERTVKVYIQLLKDAGIIKRVGTNRKGYWEIISQDKDNQNL